MSLVAKRAASQPTPTFLTLGFRPFFSRGRTLVGYGSGTLDDHVDYGDRATEPV